MTTISVTQQKITSGLNPFARGAIINGKRVERWLHEQLDRPLRWKKPRHIILTADLFGDWVTDEKLGEIFAAMAVTPQHTYQVLTKRAERMLDYLADPDTRRRIVDCIYLNTPREEIVEVMHWLYVNGTIRSAGTEDDEIEYLQAWPLPNLWLGVSVEDQKHKSRIDLLRQTPAAVRFLSLEPLLEHLGELDLTGISWVIVGGESGPNARPFNIAWARSIIRQCKDAGVPVFMKQLGAKPYDSDLRIATPRSVIVPIDSDWTFTDKLADRKGGDWSEWPEDVRIREFPI